MRALVQRVSEARVSEKRATIAKIEVGLLIFFCAMRDDSDEDISIMAKKISNLRIFNDHYGKMNKSICETNGSVLLVSQFTLAADTRRGNRPGFSQAAEPKRGKKMYFDLKNRLIDMGLRVEIGQFGSDMQVCLINDGPVTIWLDTSQKDK